MFIAGLFTIAKIWKPSKCAEMDEWIKKLRYIYVYICIYVCVYTYIYIYVCIHTHTVAYYSDIKKNKILPFEITWMALEGIMLSEISQTEKDKYHMCGI